MAGPPGIHSALAGTKPWVRLIGILGFISAGFMIVVGVVGAVFGTAFGDLPPSMGVVFLIYPLMGALYLVPSLYLFRYATRIGEYMRDGQEVQLELALQSQRSFWRFVGILSLIGIVLMLLGIVAAIAIPTMLRLQGQ